MKSGIENKVFRIWICLVQSLLLVVTPLMQTFASSGGEIPYRPNENQIEENTSEGSQSPLDAVRRAVSEDLANLPASEEVRLQQQILGMDRLPRKSQIKDIFRLSNQSHRTYKTVLGPGGKLIDVVDKEFSLDRVNTSNPYVPITNPRNDVRIVYDSAASELRFERIKVDSKSGQIHVTDDHVIKGIKLSTNEGEPILQDSNLVLFSSEDGVRAFFWPLVADLIFKASMPLFPVQVAASQIAEGAKFSKIEFASPELEPQPLLNLKGEQLSVQGGHDLNLKVTLPNNSISMVQLNYREEVLKPISIGILHFLKQLQIASPDLESFDVVANLLQKNAEDLDEYLAAQEEIVASSESDGSDLQQQVLVSLGSQINSKAVLSFVKPDKNGKNAFDRLQNKPDYKFSADVSANSSWARDREIILKARGLDANAGQPQRSWREILISEALKDSKPEISMASVSNSYLSRIFAAAKKYSLAKHVAVLAGMIGIDVINANTNNIVSVTALEIISQMFSWTLHVPLLGSMAHEFVNAGPYFLTSFALTKVMVGLAAMLALRPLSLFTAQKIAQFSGKSWDKVKAYFTLGSRIYGRLNYPLQKLFWEKLLRQRNLYLALDKGIPITAPGVWNSPGADDKKIDQGKEALNQYVIDKVKRRERSALIAAIIVSEKQILEGKPIDPATLMLLLNASASEKADQFSKAISSTDVEVKWTDLTQKIYSSLAWMSDKGIGEIDASSIDSYHKAFSKIAKDFYDCQPKAKDPLADPSTKIVGWVREKWTGFKALTSKKILSFLSFGMSGVSYVAFGKSGYDAFRKFKDIELSQRDAETAYSQYKEDYDFSAVFYAGSDPQQFGAMTNVLAPALSVPPMAEVTANQMEQIFIYGVQTGIDTVVVSASGTSELKNDNAPLSDSIFQRDKLKKDGGTGREQSMLEASKAIGEQLVNPEAKRSVIRTHLGRMKNTFTGLQVRFLAGLVPRILALSLIAMVTTWVGSHAGQEAANAVEASAKAHPGLLASILSAAPKQLNVLFNKLTISVLPGKNGLNVNVGYAAIWAFILFSMNVIKDKAEEKSAELKLADHLLDQGQRLDLKADLVSGVEKMQSLFGQNLPARFAIEAKSFTPELAFEFLNYAKANPPVSTVASKSTSEWLNRLGAFISTVVFLSLSRDMYDPHLAVGPQLLKSVAFFGVTYLGFSAAQPIINSALAKAKSFGKATSDSCLRMLRVLRKEKSE